MTVASTRGRNIEHARTSCDVQQHHYYSILAHLKEAVFLTDLDGSITDLNPAWTAITGFTQHEGLGQALWGFLHPLDRIEARSKLQSLLLGAAPDCHFRTRYLAQDRRTGWMDLCAHSVRDCDGEIIGLAGSFSDITEYQSLQKQRSVELAVTDILADCVGLGEALPKFLKAICQFLDWEYGELWMPPSPQERPQCVESWCCLRDSKTSNLSPRNKVNPALSLLNESLIFGLAEDFIDQLWTSSGLAWFKKFRPDLNSSCPMRSAGMIALSIPISFNSEYLGVMVFFSRADHPIDESLLRRLGLIGNQIGEFVLRIQAEKQLRQQHQRLQSELKEAAVYMRSLLPKPMTEGVSISHQFVPSQQLGGDAFGYYWLDPNHLALFLLDVSGHGVRSTLLAAGVLEILRHQSLLKTDFYQPHSVLSQLNRVFQMNDNGKDYFTIWYGVYNRNQRTLSYASAGHPPALLLSDTSQTKVQALHSSGVPIGMLPEVIYRKETLTITSNSTLYLFSDGVYEINEADGNRWKFEQFTDLLITYHQHRLCNLGKIYSEICSIHGQEILEDDFSLIEAKFID